ncbi:hypothetical protein [Streptomyces sp. NPDC003401]
MRPTTHAPPRAAMRPPDGARTLRLARPATRSFPDRPASLTGVELKFMTQFLAAFGAEPDHERYARGGGNSFTVMTRELLDSLDRPPAAADRVLLAYHLPDMSVVEVAGCYLAEYYPGKPEVFSVSGQGVGAPFTALRILDRTHTAGGLHEGAVFVLDQSTLPYFDPDAHAEPHGDSAVLLRTDNAEGDDPGAVMELDLLDERVTGPGAALTLLLGDGHEQGQEPRARIVVGRTLAELLDPEPLTGHDLIVGAPDRLCTSAWAALAEHWSPDRYTVVADYDPHSGRLFRAGLRPGAAS